MFRGKLKTKNMSETVPSTTIENPGNNLWTPEKGEFGFKVEILPEAPAPVPVAEAFSTVGERVEHLIDRYNQADGVRIIGSPSELSPNEQALFLQANVMVAVTDF